MGRIIQAGPRVLSSGGGGSGGGYNPLTVVSGTATPDYGLGFCQQVTIAANVAIAVPIRTGGTITAGDEFELRIDQDATGGWSWTFNAIYRLGAFDGLVGALSTFAVFRFRYDGTNWFLNATPLMDIPI